LPTIMSGKIYWYHKALSVIASFSLLLNSLWGVFLYPQSVLAQEASDSAQLLEPSPTPSPSPTPTPELNDVEQTVDSLIEELEAPQVSAESATLAPTLWEENEDGSITTVDTVGEGVEYRYKDTQVKVVFTKLTTPGYLTIREFEPENAEGLGILGKAYEITSDMQDGTFTYDLTLPLPDETEDGFLVKYAESPEELSDAQLVDKPVEVADDTVTIRDLDHFTVFIIDDGDGDYDDNNWNVYTSGGCGNNDHRWVRPSQSGKKATWTLSSDAPSGNYIVLVSWTAWDNHATNAHYKVYASGSLVYTSVDINQKLLADGSSASNGTCSGWYRLGDIFSLSPGDYVELTVENGTTDGNLVADTVAFVDLSEIWIDDDWSGNSVGDDLGDGKIFGYNAFATIQEGIDAVAESGTVDVAVGTYTEQLTIVDKALTLTGESKTGVVVQADVVQTGSGNTFTINAPGKDITIQEMTIRHGDYGIRSKAGNVNVLNSIFYKNGCDGTALPSPITQSNMSTWWNTYCTDGGAMRIENSNSSEIAYNTVYNNDRGIRYQDGNNGDIHDNESYSNVQSGIYLASSDYKPSHGSINTNVYNNIVHGNMNNGLLSIGGYNNTFENNNVYDNWNAGVEMWFVGENDIINNTITHNNLYSFNAVGDSGDAYGGVVVDDGKGIYPGSAYVAKIINNTITGNEAGAQGQKIGIHVKDSVSISNGIVIEDNVLSNHDIDILISDEASTTNITGNSFGSPAGIKNNVDAMLNAKNNWWGDATGPFDNINTDGSIPADNPGGLGSGVYGKVDYSEWAVNPDFTFNPPTNLGWNIRSESLDPGERPVDLACGEITNADFDIYGNGEISQNWELASAPAGVKYQRQYMWPGSSGWTTDGTVYTKTYTPFSTFGSLTGTEGEWSTRVRAWIDVNGNNSLDEGIDTISQWSNECTITYDRTPPVTNEPLDSPEDGSFWNKPIQIQGVSTDNFLTDLVNLFYSIADLGDWQAIDSISNPENDDVFDWSYLWTPAEEGVFDIKAAAVDAAGNEETSAYAEDVTYDVNPPSIPVLTWPIGGEATNDNTPLMQWEDSTDDGSGVAGYYYRIYYNCSNPNDIPTSCSSVYPNSEGKWRSTSEYQAGTTKDGAYYWQVRAEDNAGNLSDWSELEKVTIDAASPSAPVITFPAAEDYFNSAPILNQWTAVSDPSGIDYYRIQYEYDDGHTFSGYPYRTTTNTWRNHSPASWEQGGVKFRVQAFDKAGNEGEWSDWRHYFYDIEAPDAPTLLSIADGVETSDTSPTLTWEQPSDNLDPYGINNKSGFDNYRVQVASSPEFVSPERNYYTDNTSYTPSLWEGVWYWRVKARDDADNWSDWSEVWQFTVDTTAPQSSFTSPKDGAIFGGPEGDPIYIEGDSTDEPADTVAYTNLYYRESGSEDGWELIKRFENTEEDEPFYWSTVWTPEENGFYDFKAIATDKAGNVEKTNYVYGVIYDTTDPTLEWTSPAEKTIISGTTVILSVATDNLSGVDSVTYHYQRDGEVDWYKITTLANSPYEYNWDTTGLDLGDYKLKARATDKAGNFVEDTRSISVAAVISGETWSRPDFGKITISWTTDRPTSGRVVYDTVSHSIDPDHPNYGYANSSGVVDTSPKTTSHTITLSGLLNGITYYWRTVSVGSPIVVSEEHRGDTFSIPGPGGGAGEGVVAGLTTETITTTTPFVAGEIEEVSVSEEEEEVLGEEAAAITPPEGEETVLGESKVIRIILWGGAIFGGLILIYYFFFRRRKKR